MIEFIDTHCHLNFDPYIVDLHQVISDAISSGVNKFIVPGVDLPSSQKAIALTEQYPQIHAAVGVHPNDAKSWNNNSRLMLKRCIDNKKIVAIGEIGLDLYRSPSTLPLQIQILSEQLALAQELDLPVIIHNRDSSAELVRILRNYKVRGVFHAFDGNPAILEFGISQGYYFGIGGNATYPKTNLTVKVLESVIHHSVLETDSPFLTPVPFRGKRNDPSYIKMTADFISDKVDLGLDILSKVFLENTYSLFNLAG